MKSKFFFKKKRKKHFERFLFKSPTTYTSLISNPKQLIVFTESTDQYKKLDESLKNIDSTTPVLNCANFNNAELQENLYVSFFHSLNFHIDEDFSFSFDVCLLLKSFNRLKKDEKEKILENLLKTLKVGGEVFVYETEWTNEQSQLN